MVFTLLRSTLPVSFVDVQISDSSSEPIGSLDMSQADVAVAAQETSNPAGLVVVIY
jgi:hypothetical protein